MIRVHDFSSFGTGNAEWGKALASPAMLDVRKLE